MQKGHVAPVPLQQVPVVDVAFSRLSIDLIGPITPVSARGHRYALRCVDVATRYPFAIPLKGVLIEEVAEALVKVFSDVGIPDEILSDQGMQFTSYVMREVMRLLLVSQLHSTPYHPQMNGIVERFNGTIKTMLKRLMAEKPTDWDRYLPAALFAYREIRQESTGFAPFELYGRVPKGPSQLLYQALTGTEVDPDLRTTSQFVVDLKDSLEEMVRLAQDSVQVGSARNRRYPQRKAKVCSLVAGKKVLVLPDGHSKMLLRWKEPFLVVKKVNVYNYVVKMDDGVEKLFHINLLKEFVERPEVAAVELVLVGVVTGENLIADDVEKVEMRTVPTSQTETVADVVFNKMSSDQHTEMSTALQSHVGMLTD